MFQTSFQSATSTCHALQAGVVQCGLSHHPVLFSLYINDKPTPSCHVKLEQYMDDMAVIAMSHIPLLLITYLETYLHRLDHLLQDWRIALCD